MKIDNLSQSYIQKATKNNHMFLKCFFAESAKMSKYLEAFLQIGIRVDNKSPQAHARGYYYFIYLSITQVNSKNICLDLIIIFLLKIKNIHFKSFTMDLVSENCNEKLEDMSKI